MEAMMQLRQKLRRARHLQPLQAPFLSKKRGRLIAQGSLPPAWGRAEVQQLLLAPLRLQLASWRSPSCRHNVAGSFSLPASKVGVVERKGMSRAGLDLKNQAGGGQPK